ncbi:sensor histidine kinase [Paenibacillus methanolicus]|uniref:histidine kinase n=1 Tax=Paenibacillus methanolicus TaxID=582686 RepID=A0A5S5BU63_9BACL|nr:ATP-binding protein [Paenibacillus methanolicus]TYP70711.1 two-component system chemotaxis sensor kinase CheA [Paenibacillus methanolicus]
MTLAKTFFASISMMITIAYLFNIGYKYLFEHASARMKYGLAIVCFIVSGWLAMVFGVRVGAITMLDLRFVPTLVAVLVLPSPWMALVIGAGIGLGRFFFSWDLTAVLGCVTMVIIGAACAGLHIAMKRVAWRYLWKSVFLIVAVNLLNSALATGTVLINGSMTPWAYWTEVTPYALPSRLLMCALFLFIFRDFQKEQQRTDELRTMNKLLRRQTRQLRDAKRDIEAKAKELELASTYKSEFLANMSHELKTPLNSIILLAQLIRDNEEDRYNAEDTVYAELIQTAGNDLLQLINDILDLSKVEAGRMDIVIDRVSTHDMVQNLHHQFLPLAQQKGLRFEADVHANVPCTIMTDALRTNQILRNLLVNAFKFTSEGSVRLAVRLEAPAMPKDAPKRGRGRVRHGAVWDRQPQAEAEIAAAGGETPSVARPRLAFTVTDTGIGIDKEKQELIFEAFRQENGAINRMYGGTGLGLSISRQLATLLGGKLGLRSEKHKGSEFTLYLPLQPPGGAQPDGTDQSGGTDESRSGTQPELARSAAT